ncbi:hypothetical protein GALL_519780 [mine drainage metagenome]|uniref:Uncharacterized protein n=1 Tax=mine drainage metagenome TaxID=410659 RepID=A0A1J5P5I3_9ZZZZ
MECGPLVPEVFKLLEPWNGFGGDRLYWPGCHQVHPDILRAKVPGEVPGAGFERGFSHSHPVVFRPGDAGIEIKADDTGALGRIKERFGRHRQRFEREGGDLNGGGNIGPLGVQEIPAERSFGREGYRVENPVKTWNMLSHSIRESSQILIRRDIKFDDRCRRRQPRRDPFG